MHRLIPHSASPPAHLSAITVRVDRARATWSFDYAMAGGQAVVLPGLADPGRADGLWRTTCFELFVKPMGGESYFEFNFSPSTRWAAYAFAGYREGVRDWPLPPPRIARTAAGLVATLDLSGAPPLPWRVGLSAVIEEEGGAISYWALAHPPGKADFHHPDCFALELPAAV